MFGERVCTHALNAFGANYIDNVIAQQMATHCFMAGTCDDRIIKMLCRNRPATLNNAIQCASNETSIQAQVNTLTVGRTVKQPQHEPMEVNSITEQLNELKLATAEYEQVKSEYARLTDLHAHDA